MPGCLNIISDTSRLEATKFCQNGQKSSLNFGSPVVGAKSSFSPRFCTKMAKFRHTDALLLKQFDACFCKIHAGAMSILIFLVLKAITFLPESFRNECILQFVDVLPTAKAGGRTSTFLATIFGWCWLFAPMKNSSTTDAATSPHKKPKANIIIPLTPTSLFISCILAGTRQKKWIAQRYNPTHRNHDFGKGRSKNLVLSLCCSVSPCGAVRTSYPGLFLPEAAHIR